MLPPMKFARFFGPLLAVLLLAPAARAAEDCCGSNTFFLNDCPGANQAELWCSRFRSKFDGASDFFFIKFPPGYDKNRPTPVFIFYRAYGQSGGALSDPRMFESVGARYGAIVIGHPQRCEEPCMGNRNDALSSAGAQNDVNELVNQLTSRFNVSHVFVVGASMGGVVAYRLQAQFPTRFSGALGSVAAICMNSDSGPPDCAGSFYQQATMLTYGAAQSGAWDDKLIYSLIGQLDETTGINPGNRHLWTLMMGKPWFYGAEVTGHEHENFYFDDYNVATTNMTEWLISNPAAPNLEMDIKRYLMMHDRGAMDPEAGWTAPADAMGSYLSDKVLTFSGRNVTMGGTGGAGAGGAGAGGSGTGGAGTSGAGGAGAGGAGAGGAGRGGAGSAGSAGAGASAGNAGSGGTDQGKKDPGGCATGSAGGTSALWAMGLALLLLRRRR